MTQPMHFAVRDYSAPNTEYPDHNVYSAKTNEQWSIKKDALAIECDVCLKKCNDVFMRVYRGKINTNNFCSVTCWGKH